VSWNPCNILATVPQPNARNVMLLILANPEKWIYVRTKRALEDV
jgi:hypothetical protein